MKIKITTYQGEVATISPSGQLRSAMDRARLQSAISAHIGSEYRVIIVDLDQMPKENHKFVRDILDRCYVPPNVHLTTMNMQVKPTQERCPARRKRRPRSRKRFWGTLLDRVFLVFSSAVPKAITGVLIFFVAVALLLTGNQGIASAVLDALMRLRLV